ncbi:hypothetical protein L9F63_002016 [Diploptera punctata]|uniref:Major facilitator superfamily (MFS) profile domain-containing protein n=1 Tax=Diploptera punctata TaxID=6984 RepID=A0AAD8A2G7_DIPPU|nr:hypothetical protein L9F63_002016 [Diploptera punctata]
MSVVIVAMVRTDSKENETVSNVTTVAIDYDDVCPGETSTSTTESNGEFDWNEKLQGYVLSATGYGIIITHLIGGRLSEKFGPKYIIGISLFFTGMFTVLCPLFARLHVIALIVLRVLIGIVSGVILPSMHVVISRWYTVEERQFMSSIIFTSSSFSTVLTLSTSGVIADAEGWPFVFYLFGGLTTFWIIPWLLFVYDSPEEHPYISDKEKSHILNSLAKYKNDKASKIVPWLAILTSLPVWAHIVFGFGHSWVSATVTSELPTYLSRMLHFSLKQSGLTSAIPFIFTPIGAVLFGYMNQKVRMNGYLSPLNSIRLFNTVCGVICPIILFTITLVGCDAMATLVLLCFSQLATSAYSGGSLVNNMDLASNYAGTLSGMSTTIIATASILSPLVVGELTNNNQTLTQWHIVFYITVSITLFSYVFFIIFGSVEEQSWNRDGMNNNESQTEVSEKQPV